MIEYPSGYEPDLWRPDPEQKTHRFALGNVGATTMGDPPFVAVCMNPSYADRSRADKTVNRVIEASVANKHPGWVMLNLYPERATSAASLAPYDAHLSTANCEAIGLVLGQHGVTEVLGAWGDLKHPTLRRAKQDVLDTLDRLGVRLFTFDGLTVRGDPLHPTPRGKALVMRGDKRYLVRSGNRLVEMVA